MAGYEPSYAVSYAAPGLLTLLESTLSMCLILRSFDDAQLLPPELPSDKVLP